jgi:hypothetical protein
LCAPADVPSGPVGGKTIRVWVLVCDAEGRDIATKDTEVTALDVDGGALPKLPGDREFHRNAFGFFYDVDGSTLSAGVHVLHVAVSGDPVVHGVSFTVPKPRK